MSVGSVGKWFALSVLVAASALGATGCKDDDGDEAPVKDAGPKDSGTPAPVDAGKPDATAPVDSSTPVEAAAPACPPAAVTCGGKTCAPHTTSAGTFCAGCAKDSVDAEVCGISTKLIGFPEAGPAYLEIHAPGVDSVSCGVVLDNFDTDADGGVAPADAGTKKNMKLDRFVSVGGMSIQLSTPGCCTPKGFCSGQVDKGEADIGGTKIASNGGFGCMDSFSFLRTAPAQYQAIPCDVDSGVLKPAPTDGGTSDGGTSDAGDAGVATDASADASGG